MSGCQGLEREGTGEGPLMGKRFCRGGHGGHENVEELGSGEVRT